MDGKPASDWPLIIDAYNRSLLYDDDGNIISIIPFNAGGGDGYIVLRNGEYDAPYTAQLNQEQNSQFWQTLGDQAAQLLLGISEVIGGSVLWLGSSALGAGGLALSIPSGGTVTIPAAAVASAGYVTSGTLIAGGTITVTDAISQIAAANSNLQVSFAKGYDEWNRGNKNNIDNTDIPDHVTDTLNKIRNNKGNPPEGYKGGKIYNNNPKNGGSKLPEGPTYKEYDVHPKIKGVSRGSERLVIGDDGSVWYTNDHYDTFIRIE